MTFSKNLFFLSAIFFIATSFTLQDEVKDPCPCKSKKELTHEDVLCMNSAAKFYSCLTNKDIKPSEIESFGFYIFTGERTIMNRYDKDTWSSIIRKYLPEAKEFRIRGLQLKEKDGEPGVYLRKEAKIKFKVKPPKPDKGW